MSRVVRITIPAQQDLRELGEYWKAYGEGLAEQRLTEIQKRFLQLRDFPGLGRSREDLAPGLRSIVVQDIVILYRVLEGLVAIVRVLRGQRDLKRVLEESEEDA